MELEEDKEASAKTGDELESEPEAETASETQTKEKQYWNKK